MRHIKTFVEINEMKSAEMTNMSKLEPISNNGYEFSYVMGDYTIGDSVSDCCGAEPRGNGDSDSSDIGICPDCQDHCEYINPKFTTIVGQLSKAGKSLGQIEINDTDAGDSEETGIGYEFTRRKPMDKDVLELVKLVVENPEAKKLLA